MTAPHPEIIVVRRRGSEEDAHHGGAWKIAFADFMTAMMAFFLVLWIISATDKNTKTLIARYFNPVKVEEPAKAQKGIHGVPEKDAYAAGADTAAPSGGKPSSERGGATGEKADEGAPAGSSNQYERPRPPTPSTVPPPDPAKPYPTMSEQELFSDPRASLDKIAGAPPPGPRIDPSAAMKGYGEVGPSADEALRDPFRPLGSDQAVNVVAHDPRPARGRRPQRRTGFHVDVDCVSGWVADGLRRSAGARRSSRRGIARSGDALSAGSRRSRSAPDGRIQPARRLEEAARRRGQGDAGP